MMPTTGGDSEALNLFIDFALDVLDSVLQLLATALPQLLTTLLDAFVDLIQPAIMM